MLTTYAQNLMWDALNITHASLHSGYPGTTGLNELSGGSYARQSPSAPGASGGVRTLGSRTYAVPASTVRWEGYWSNSNFLGCAPNGGQPMPYIADATADTIFATGHGIGNGEKVVLWGGTVPGGIVEGDVYFVVSATTDTFKLALTSGGTPIDLTSANYGGRMSAIIEDVYAAPGSHTVSSTTLGMPF